MQPAETYDYNYQYDGTAGDGEQYLRPGYKAANIYDVKPDPEGNNQLLKAVGFVTQLDGHSSFRIDIYKNVNRSISPESGRKVYTTTFETDNIGFYTVPIAGKRIVLKPGDNYSVVITSQSYTYLGVEKSMNRGFVTFNAALKAGESYMYSPVYNSWQDASQLGWCARIKGFVRADTSALDGLHVHTLEKIPAKEATCTEAGHKEYWRCTECGDLFADEEGTLQIEEPETINALGHNFVRVIDKEPKDGLPGMYHERCTRCGAIRNERMVIKGSLNNAEITIIGQCTYTGNQIKPDIQVIVGGSQLAEGRDYTIEFANNINAGNAIVIIRGIGDFEGRAGKTFRINPAPITGIELSRRSFVYTGKTLRPEAAAVYAGGAVPKDGYSVTNAGGRAVGTYTGTLTRNFTVRPRGTSINRLYRKNRAFAVK